MKISVKLYKKDQGFYNSKEVELIDFNNYRISFLVDSDDFFSEWDQINSIDDRYYLEANGGEYIFESHSSNVDGTATIIARKSPKQIASTFINIFLKGCDFENKTERNSMLIKIINYWEDKEKISTILGGR